MKLTVGQLKEIIREAAITPEQASKQKLALLIFKEAERTEYVLYDPSYFINFANKIIQKKWEHIKREHDNNVETAKKAFNKYVVLQFISDVFDNQVQDGVYGYMEVADPSANDGPCWDSSEVRFASAVKGYGPMMYDIAMFLAPEHRIHADRTSVSKDAQGVWTFFKKNRRDVEALPFDDIEDPQTDNPEDDCAVHKPGEDHPVDYSYEGSKNPSVSGLKSVNDKFINGVLALAGSTPAGKNEEIWIEPHDVEVGLVSAGKWFFDALYERHRSSS